jgi:hypothetical protein
MQLFQVIEHIRTVYLFHILFISFISSRVYAQGGHSSCIDFCPSDTKVTKVPTGSLEQSCYCTHCDLYNDCCLNKQLPGESVNYKCNVKIENNQFIYSIVNCIKDWANEIIKHKCENESLDEEIYDMVPVYSDQTRLVYRNIYCAYCNMNSLEVTDHVEFFKLKAVSYVKDQLHLNQSYLIASVFNDMLKHRHNHHVSRLKFDLYFQKPFRTRNRTCVPAHDICAENSSRIESELCKNRTAYRLGENKVIYKNEHCAICNGVKLEELSCAFPSYAPRYKPIKSLQLLFDFKYLAKNKMDMLIVLNDGNKTDLSTECENKALDDFVCKNTLVENLNQIKKRSCKYLSDEIAPNDQIKVVITRVGQSISILSLLLLLSIYFSKRILRNLPGKILICLSLSLLFSQTFFLLSTYITEPIESIESFVFENECANKFSDRKRLFQFIHHALDCYVIGAFIHYFYLSFFAWSLIMAYDLYKMFKMLLNKSSSIKDDDDTQIFIRYSIVAWAIPFLIVFILFSSQFVSTFRTAYAYGTCFISNQIDILVYFILPISLILLTNAYFLFVSIRSIRSVDSLSNKYLRRDCSNENSTSQSHDGNVNNKSLMSRIRQLKLTNKKQTIKSSCDKKRTWLFLKLFILTGMSWMFGIVNSFTQSTLIWYMYIVLNSFQGLFIFFAFAFNSQTKRELRNSLFYSQISKLFSLGNKSAKSTSTSSSLPRGDSHLPSKQINSIK